MDKNVLILLIVLAVIIGLFLLFATGSDGGTTGSAIANSYPTQYGGGCGR